MPDDEFGVGDRVEVRLDAKVWGRAGWFPGVVVRIEPYSEHRRFYWVELEATGEAAGLPRLLSVLNPRNIRGA